MIKDATERKLLHKIVLFYSNRRPEDAPFLAELQNLAEQNTSFKLIATITEPEKSAQSWQGETGVIDRAMLEKYLDDLKSPIYYVAGLPDMVGAMQTVLAEELGVSKDNIRAEEFTGFEMGHDEEASCCCHLIGNALVETAQERGDSEGHAVSRPQAPSRRIN